MEQREPFQQMALKHWPSQAKNEKKKKKEKVNTDLTLFTKTNSKIDHRPKCKIQTYNTPKDNIRENLNDLGFGNDFLDKTRKA